LGSGGGGRFGGGERSRCVGRGNGIVALREGCVDAQEAVDEGLDGAGLPGGERDEAALVGVGEEAHFDDDAGDEEAAEHAIAPLLDLTVVGARGRYGGLLHEFGRDQCEVGGGRAAQVIEDNGGVVSHDAHLCGYAAGAFGFTAWDGVAGRGAERREGERLDALRLGVGGGVEVEAEEEFGAPEVGQMGSVLEGEVDIGGAGEPDFERRIDLVEAVTEPLGDEQDEVLLCDLGDADGSRLAAAMARVDEEPMECGEGASGLLRSNAAELYGWRSCPQRPRRGNGQEERCEGCDGASGS
jgi:hypothetical protein